MRPINATLSYEAWDVSACKVALLRCIVAPAGDALTLVTQIPVLSAF